ncbi:UvrD-helicase domain-containing protein [Alicyclobacillus tolerans]|uniref:DNA 3'-5' helicase n=1 Tax=Alicyclobacillus tolerans TaxID=90970 RepID=A0A1M6K505_9BACL|nr:UvrD-helicase domain-containing protein [Alicyclobacillus montanus]SHJ54021.1 DNA helicase/exodeoxyribonuclease V, subunit A [Alicyclobacillus montanus]
MNSWLLPSFTTSQLQAITAKEGDTLVFAGAGSGKTSALVERVLYMLLNEPEMSMERMLLVTFTEAAAEQMKARIGKRLQDCLQGPLTTSERRKILLALRQLPYAQISTLHAFCNEVVKKNFLLLGISPDVRLMDEAEQRYVWHQTANVVVEDQLQNPAVQLLIESLGLQAEKLAEVLMDLYRLAVSQPEPIAWLTRIQEQFAAGEQLVDEPWFKDFFQWVADGVEEAGIYLRKACDLASMDESLQRYHDSLEQMLLLWPSLSKALADRKIEDVSASIEEMLNRTGRPAVRGSAPYIEEIKLLRNEAMSLLKNRLELLKRGSIALHSDLMILKPAVDQLIDLTKLYAERLWKEKLILNVLDFHDLEQLAYQVLSRSDTAERHLLQEQFIAVFIDEYQDTSPIQNQILQAIRRPDGNLFMVGDIKQSIYRFRMAEPSLFLEAFTEMRRDRPSSVVYLQENFRSRVEVVEFVNWLFRHLFQEDTVGFVYDEQAEMRAAGQYPDGQGSVEIHLIENTHQPEDREADQDDEEGSADWQDLLNFEKEAHYVAWQIAAMIGKIPGQMPYKVWDGEQQQLRTALASDVAILLRSPKGRTGALVDALFKYGIAAQSDEQESQKTGLEIVWLHALMAVLVNARREFDLAVLLKSPFVRLQDQQLAEIRTLPFRHLTEAVRLAASAQELPDGSLISEQTRSDLRRFLSQLQSWRHALKERPFSNVLRQIVAETNYLEYVLGMPDGTFRAQQVEAFLKRADKFVEGHADHLSDFLAVEERLQGMASPSVTQIGEGENNAVRILSIHKSKGLEFPIVWIAGLGSGFNRKDLKRSLFLHRHYGIGPQMRDILSMQRWKTAVHLAMEHREEAEMMAEEARILYVAMTRAKEHLRISGYLPKSENRIAELLLQSESSSFSAAFRHAANMGEWFLLAFCRTAPLRNLVESQLEQSGEAKSMQWENFRVKVIPQSSLESMFVHQIEEKGKNSNPSLRLKDSESVSDWLHRLKSQFTDRNSLTVRVVESPQSFDFAAKISATELRRLVRQQEQTLSSGRAEQLLAKPIFAMDGTISGRHRGTAFHQVMLHLPFAEKLSEEKLCEVLNNLVAEGKITEDIRLSVDLSSIQQWLNSELATRLRHAEIVLREQPFFGKLSLFSQGTSDVDPFVIIQGVMDVLAKDKRGWFVVDYKTDRVQKQGIQHLLKDYQPQIEVYRRIAQNVVGEDVQAYLYFVDAAVTWEVLPISLEQMLRSVILREDI